MKYPMRARFGALMEYQPAKKSFVCGCVGSPVFDNRNFDGGFASSKTGTLLPADASPSLYQKIMAFVRQPTKVPSKNFQRKVLHIRVSEPTWELIFYRFRHNETIEVLP